MATSKSNSASVDADDIKEQFHALRDEMKVLTELVTTGISEQSVITKEAALERADMLRNEAVKKASQLHSEAKDSITANPIAAVAMFAGIGFILGALFRK